MLDVVYSFFSISEIETLYNKAQRKNQEYFFVQGYKIRADNELLKLFFTNNFAGVHCCCCQRFATTFVLEASIPEARQARPHLGLYLINNNYPDGLLFTKDHIVPKSKNGPDDFSNYQVMCQECNSLKSDLDNDEFFKKYDKLVAQKAFSVNGGDESFVRGGVFLNNSCLVKNGSFSGRKLRYNNQYRRHIGERKNCLH